MPEVSIGRIVHYQGNDGKPHPAQIVAVFPQAEKTVPLLNLIVTLDGLNDREEGGTPSNYHVWRTSIPHASSVGAPATYPPNTWHWPPGM